MRQHFFGRMFIVYISYVIPLTAFSIWLTSRIGSHVGMTIVSPGFGFYSCVLLPLASGSCSGACFVPVRVLTCDKFPLHTRS
jgi:hypothetical protein